MYEQLWTWCRGMTAHQVNFVMNGSLVLAALSFLCLLLAGWALMKKRGTMLALAGGGVALTALLSWGFLSLALMQSGKQDLWHQFFERSPLMGAVYCLFAAAGVVLLVLGMARAVRK